MEPGSGRAEVSRLETRVLDNEPYGNSRRFERSDRTRLVGALEQAGLVERAGLVEGTTSTAVDAGAAGDSFEA